MAGWIKLHRALMEWEWYSDANTTRVFIHLLLSANHKPNYWRGTKVENGQIIIGRKKLAEKLRLSERQVRTAINHLISTNEIATETTNKYTLVTLLNWGKYQDTDSKSDQQNDQQEVKPPTNKRPTNDQQPTTNKNEKNKKNEKNDKEDKNKIDAFFEKCWKLYPNKKGKASIKDACKKKIYLLGEEFERALQRYIDYVNSEEWLHFQNGSTFWNSGHVDYLDANYEKPKPKKTDNKNEKYPRRYSEEEYNVWDKLEDIE